MTLLIHRAYLLIGCFSVLFGSIQGMRLSGHRLASRSNTSAKDSLPNNTDTALLFKVVNTATLPVNFMALSAAIRLHASVHNEMPPGQQANVEASLGWYDFYLTTSQENVWQRFDQVGWGLMKDTTAVTVSMLVGAGVTGSIAATSGAAVTAALTSVVAPPVAVGLGVAALLGVGVFTTLTVSQITEASFEAAALALKKMKEKDRSLPDHIGDGLFRFKHVAEELDVQIAFASALHDERARRGSGSLKWKEELSHVEQLAVLDNVVMTQATAEAYYGALQAVFSTSVLGGSSTRKFVIAGGFTLPAPHSTKPEYGVVEFTPLQIAEDVPDHGCLHEDNEDGYWVEKLGSCEYQCKLVEFGKKGQESCLETCRSTLSGPVKSERMRGALRATVRRFEGTKLRVIDDGDEILRATRAAGITETNDAARLQYKGKLVEVHSVDPKDFTARVVDTKVEKRGGLTPTSVWFPLEALQPTNSEKGFQSIDRMTLQAEQYGECWSRYEGGFWNGARKLFGEGSWCHSAPKGEFRFHFGQVCSPAEQDACRSVKTDSSWECID